MQIKMGDANIPATTTFVHQPFEEGTQRNNFATMLMWQRPKESPQFAPFRETTQRRGGQPCRLTPDQSARRGLQPELQISDIWLLIPHQCPLRKRPLTVLLRLLARQSIVGGFSFRCRDTFVTLEPGEAAILIASLRKASYSVSLKNASSGLHP
jgi:hypothetical protein